MALFEDMFKGGGATGIMVGAGAVLLAPVLAPVVGQIVRPVAKAVIKTGISVFREVSTQVGNATGPLVEEARAELAAKE
jgi:hypothetical protein